jgi:dolichol-phosphate mannosyltransferase
VTRELSLSVVIPAHDEAESITPVLAGLSKTLTEARIPHEIIVVDDHSSDGTRDVVEAAAATLGGIRCIQNQKTPGFGMAVRAGLESFTNDAVAIVMADGSDDPRDVVRCYRELLNGCDCVFGSRFMRGSRVVDYPRLKLAVNRLANLFVRLLFRIPLNDTTNAFKCYRREVIEGLQPILSNHFNLTVELPLKAIVRGYTFRVIPINWYNRTEGVSKLKLEEMGSRYLFIVLYVWLEKHLARGDYAARRRLAASDGGEIARKAPLDDR